MILTIEAFIEKVKQYKADIDELKSVDQINNWCTMATHGLIKEIIQELLINSDDFN